MPVTILGFQASSGQWGPGAYELTIKEPDGDVQCSFTLDAGATGVVSKCNPRGTFSPVRSGGCNEIVGDAASGGDCVSTAPFDLVEYRRDGAPLSELDYRLLRDGAELAAGRVPTANACPGRTCACQKAVVDVATP